MSERYNRYGDLVAAHARKQGSSLLHKLAAGEIHPRDFQDARDFMPRKKG